MHRPSGNSHDHETHEESPILKAMVARLQMEFTVCLLDTLGYNLMSSFGRWQSAFFTTALCTG
jgi:hypothetical protein